MKEISLQQLLENGIHFGHRTKRWNPKMKPFIYTKRQGTHIIDLARTVEQLHLAEEFLKELGSQGKSIIFVATKRQAKQVVKTQAERCSAFYVNHRWVGGLVTNFASIKKSIDLYKELKKVFETDNVPDYNKKELSKLKKRYEKLTKNVGGLEKLEKLPDALFILDPNRESIAVAESNRFNIPIIAVCDTNCDPSQVTIPIPGNDDAIRSIEYFLTFAADALIEGSKLRKPEAKTEINKTPEQTKETQKSSKPKIEEISKDPNQAKKPNQILDLSDKTAKLIEKANLKIEDLQKMTLEQIMDIPGIGPKTAKEIDQAVKKSQS